MIGAIVPRSENGPVQAIEARPMAVQADPSRDAMERDLAKYSYFSPVTRIDVDTQKAVLQYRDSETGDVERQYPSKERLKAYGSNRSSAAVMATEETLAAESASAETTETAKPVALSA